MAQLEFHFLPSLCPLSSALSSTLSSLPSTGVSLNVPAVRDNLGWRSLTECSLQCSLVERRETTED